MKKIALSIRDKLAQDVNTVAKQFGLDPKALQGLTLQQLAAISRVRNVGLARQMVTNYRSTNQGQAPQVPAQRPVANPQTAPQQTGIPTFTQWLSKNPQYNKFVSSLPFKFQHKIATLWSKYGEVRMREWLDKKVAPGAPKKPVVTPPLSKRNIT